MSRPSHWSTPCNHCGTWWQYEGVAPPENRYCRCGEPLKFPEFTDAQVSFVFWGLALIAVIMLTSIALAMLG